MGYYDLSPIQRKQLYEQMQNNIIRNLKENKADIIMSHASDPDTYIRKNCSLILGRLYNDDEGLRKPISEVIDKLSVSENEKIRLTTVYALGEIGKNNFRAVEQKLEKFLTDSHHSVKNALTGALKQMGEKNPEPVFHWAKKAMNSCNPDMRKRILHGLELRGRSHPEELLPILKNIIQGNPDKKTRGMIVHIIGQISYKRVPGDSAQRA